MAVLARGAQLDCGRRIGVSGRIREQVDQDLDDAAPIRHHQRQAGLQINDHVVPVMSVREGTPGLVHEAPHVDRFERHRERARLDVGHIQQLTDQIAHVVGLGLDDAGELDRLGRVEGIHGFPQGGCRALDGRQGRPQLVAHHAQELSPQPGQVFQRRHVLDGHDRRLHAPIFLIRVDRGGVHQRSHRRAIGHLEDDFLGTPRFGAADGLRDGKLRQGDLSTIGPAKGENLEELLRGAAGLKVLNDSQDFSIERYGESCLAIEDRDADGGGVDQGLEASAGPLFVPVPACVGNHQQGLGSEHRQDFFIFSAELRRLRALGQADGAHAFFLAANGSREEGAHADDLEFGQTEGPGVVAEVGDSQRFGEPTEVLEEVRAPRGLRHEPVLRLGHPGSEQLLRLPVVVHGGHRPVAGIGERTGAVHDLLEHAVEVQGLSDAQGGLAQSRQAVSRVFHLLCAGVVSHHSSSSIWL